MKLEKAILSFQSRLKAVYELNSENIDNRKKRKEAAERESSLPAASTIIPTDVPSQLRNNPPAPAEFEVRTQRVRAEQRLARPAQFAFGRIDPPADLEEN